MLHRRFPLHRALAAALLATSLPACSDLVGIGSREAPRPLWKVLLGSDDRPSMTTPAADGERVYNYGGRLAAFDAATGLVVWSSLFAMPPKNVVVAGGRVFIASRYAVAMEAASGVSQWSFEPQGDAGFGTSAADDRAFYFGTDERRVYALDQRSGALLWRTDLGPDWRYRGIVTGVAASGDTVYAAAEQYEAANGYLSSGWVIALDRHTGRELWRYRNGAAGDRRTVSDAPVVWNHLLLVSDHWGRSLVAVDRFTGEEVWRHTGPAGRFGPSAPAVVVDGVAYVASNDENVYAFEPATGRILWSTRTRASNRSLVVCADRILVTYFGGLAVLDRATGRLRFQGRDGTDIPTSGLAAAAGRAFVFGDQSGYAYRCP